VRKLLVTIGAALLLAMPASAGPLDDVTLIAPIRQPAVGDTSGGHNNGCWEYNGRERKLARLTNRARSNNDVRTMRLDPQLSMVASRHSDRMASRGVLYHSADLGQVVTRWSTLGENVGTGPSVKSLHRAFMDSPAHRENVLYPSFRHFGVGSKKRGGRLWVTVVFEARRDPGTTLRMPRCR
jgi:uncharacterized protein YkwD